MNIPKLVMYICINTINIRGSDTYVTTGQCKGVGLSSAKSHITCKLVELGIRYNEVI